MTNVKIVIEMLEENLKGYEKKYQDYMKEAKRYEPLTTEETTATQMAIYYDGQISATKTALALLK